MAHLHSVYDTDSHFSIDQITRAIKNESSRKTTIMQFDHNSERFTFELPRSIEEHDMSLCNRVEVHYQNGGNSGVYEVDDLQLSPADEDVVICSWLISQNATQNAAALDFRLTFKCVADDGTLDYVWSTAMHKGISVSSGIHNSEVIVEQYADVLEQWKQTIGNGGGECNIPRIETAVNGKPKINLRDLESGSYILYGYFEPHADSHISISADNSLISVIRKDAGSHIICLDPLNAKVVFFEVLVDTTQESGFAYTKKVISLLDVYDIMNSGESACNVPRFESSEDTETGIRNLRELDSGVYILNGYWNAYPGADTYMPFDNRLVTVENQTAGNQLFVYETLNAKVIFHEILVDETTEDGFTHTMTTIPMLDVDGLIDKVGTLEGRLSASGVNLTDQETGAEYRIFVSGGKLKMESKETESEG